jgi:hypothetical protein
MGNRAVGGVGAGCGAFGLLGLLVSVALVVWLGSQAVDRTTGSGGSSRAETEAVDPRTADLEELADQIDELGLDGSAPGVPMLLLSPAGPYADGAEVTVSAEGLAAGPIEVSLCLTFQTRAAGPDGACDTAAGTIEAEVASDGTLATTLTARRAITVLGNTYDCGAFAGACSVIVHGGGSLTGAPTTPLDLAAEGPAPADALDPPTG